MRNIENNLLTKKIFNIRIWKKFKLGIMIKLIIFRLMKGIRFFILSFLNKKLNEKK